MPTKKILIADDEAVLLHVLHKIFTKEGYEVDTSENGEDALIKIMNEKYDLVILDKKMPKKTGIDVLREIKKQNLNVMVIIMTAFGTIDNAVEAIKLGAFDYIEKPFENDDIIEKVKKALKVKEKMVYSYNRDDDHEISLIGESKEIKQIKKIITKIQNIDSTILLSGESGTGKGVIAKEIHMLSDRKNSPFVHLNCAVLPNNLIESELFGHEKGSFTGAYESKEGKFEQAKDGTIFLDEIGTLDNNMQAKLLTVLQEKNFQRIGSSITKLMTARVIAATNLNIEEAVHQNQFREDLYYRLNIVRIDCPPLRFRKEDIPLLCENFIKKLNARLGRNINKIADDVMEIFMEYNWPGNVRELENTIESSIVLSEGNTLTKDDLPLRVTSSVNKSQNIIEKNYNLIEEKEMNAINAALNKHNGHREKTAQELGISRRSLQYKLKKYGII